MPDEWCKSSSLTILKSGSIRPVVEPTERSVKPHVKPVEFIKPIPEAIRPCKRGRHGRDYWLMLELLAPSVGREWRTGIPVSGLLFRKLLGHD